MKTSHKTLLAAALALTLALGSSRPTPANAADEPAKPMAMKMTDADMMKSCQAMKAEKDKFAADTKAQDTEMTEQIAKMNAAAADKKTDIMAAILTKMVSSQAAMNTRKAKMENDMMDHMMNHMQAGKDTMTNCPMMQNMDSMKTK